MFARLRSTWFSINASYWFYPALFALAAFALAVVLIEIDKRGVTDWVRMVTLHPAQPRSASNILTVIAGSMIGVASTVFSITIAAVAYASGTYGPRLLTNFMEDKGNQLSLATFIATFVYSITVLRSVRAVEEDTVSPVGEEASAAVAGFVPQFSLLVGFGLMVVAVGVLVYFLHHIPSSIRINAVLEGIGNHLLKTIDRRFPDRFDGRSPRAAVAEGCPIVASKAGYIRVIDLGALSSLADKREIRIGLHVRTGDFLHPGKPLATIGEKAVDDELADAVRACFALGGSRTPEQDIEFSIDELVEIALRALSPGINDPFTAITAIHWLGAATARLGERDLRETIDGRKSEDCAVAPLDGDFAHFLARGFGAARAGLASHRLAALVALEALQLAALTIEAPERRRLLLREGNRLAAQAEASLVGPDLEEVLRRHGEFESALSKASIG